ncbi:MAG TPA: hypothetical protein VGP45_03900 [Marinobacter sp.]|nr:hypothetical protein [Marinobacter sp.]
MATIAPTSMTGSGERDITFTTATASDTFVYVPGSVLIINNDTGSPITPNIVGDEATTAACPGVGNVDVSGGFDFASIADGDFAAVPVDSIRAYLAGDIAMTGADGAEIALLTF